MVAELGVKARADVGEAGASTRGFREAASGIRDVDAQALAFERCVNGDAAAERVAARDPATRSGSPPVTSRAIKD